MRTRSITTLLTLLATMTILGCGPSGLDVLPVSGKVTFDGEPIPEGRIQFRAVDGDKRAFSGQITNGQYELETMPGKMTVEVTASRIIPGQFDESNPDEKVPVGEMYIPARYNSQTELTAEVPAGGIKQLDFALTSE
ncbi:MAG TPA: hypothetical protein VMY37_16870 [Thermoguttaceae bacterium]|nr:hypothetical protein [Thermoguttaceae bacterium]